MTRDELSQHDGQEGRKAYVAVNKIVYDVSASPLWQNGLHPPDHKAGQDLTEEILSAPHVKAVVTRFPVVGQLEEEVAEASQQNGGKLFVIIAIVAIIVIVGLALLL